MVIWCVAVAGSQTAPPGALSKELRTHVQAERFQVVTSLRGLPLGVRDGLQTLFGSQRLDIAEPDAEFQTGAGKGGSTLPLRRLLVAGCSYEHCLVYYERGGTARAWRVVLFQWTPDATRLEWGGAAPSGLRSIDEVRSVVLGAGTKGSAGPW